MKPIISFTEHLISENQANNQIQTNDVHIIGEYWLIRNSAILFRYYPIFLILPPIALLLCVHARFSIISCVVNSIVTYQMSIW